MGPNSEEQKRMYNFESYGVDDSGLISLRL